MKRSVVYGYGVEGQFGITINEEERDGTKREDSVVLSRAESAKISKLMQFGKTGEVRIVEYVDGKEVK